MFFKLFVTPFKQIIDFYAMVVLHGINAKKKTVDALLRQKVKSDVLTAELVERAFHSYGQVKRSACQSVFCLIAQAGLLLQIFALEKWRNSVGEETGQSFPCLLIL